MSRMRELPGPRGFPLLGTITPFIGKDLLRAFGGLVAEYGPLFGIHLPFGHRLVMVAHPDGVEQVLRSGRKNCVKGSVYDGARILLGQGLVTSEGVLWKRQRELTNPAFRPTRLARYLAVMADSTAGVLADWHAANRSLSTDIQCEMTRLTLSILGRTLFGLDLGVQHERAAKAFGAALQAIGRRGPGLLQVPLWLPTPANARFRGTLIELDQMIYRVIGEFRAGRAENADQALLGAYIESRDPETGARMDDRQLRDEIITLYFAGHAWCSACFYVSSRSTRKAGPRWAHAPWAPYARMVTSGCSCATVDRTDWGRAYSFGGYEFIAAKIEATRSLLPPAANTLICAALWFYPKLNAFASQTFGRLTP